MTHLFESPYHREMLLRLTDALSKLGLDQKKLLELNVSVVRCSAVRRVRVRT